MTRQEILEKYEEVSRRKESRSVLESYSTQELHNLYYAAVQQIQGRVGDPATPTPAGPTAELQAQRDQKLEETRRLIVEERKQAQEARLQSQIAFDLDQEKFFMEMEKLDAPKRQAKAKADLAHDRAVFQDAARTLRSFALNEANLNVLRSVIGEGRLSVSAIHQAIQTGQASLSGPTEKQLNDYSREDVEQYNDQLLRSTQTELKAVVRSEAEARREQAVAEETANNRFQFGLC